MLRLIASDIDGTLVNERHEISARTVEAIHRAQGLGCIFVVTTGRSFEDARDQVRAAGITCDYLVMNGSELRDSEGTLLQALYMDRSLVERVVARLEDEGLYVEVYTTQGVFSPSGLERRKWGTATKIHRFVPELSMRDAYELAEGHEQFQKIKPIGSLDELWERGAEVGKVVVFSSDEPKLARLREELPRELHADVGCSFPFNLEVTDPGASKGQALARYAESKSIDLADVMTVGDNYNDLSMLSPRFGHTFAMGNAPEGVKRVAKYVTKTNAQDGVACAIEQCLP